MVTIMLSFSKGSAYQTIIWIKHKEEGTIFVMGGVRWLKGLSVARTRAKRMLESAKNDPRSLGIL